MYGLKSLIKSLLISMQIWVGARSFTGWVEIKTGPNAIWNFFGGPSARTRELLLKAYLILFCIIFFVFLVKVREGEGFFTHIAKVT